MTRGHGDGETRRLFQDKETVSGQGDTEKGRQGDWKDLGRLRLSIELVQKLNWKVLLLEEKVPKADEVGIDKETKRKGDGETRRQGEGKTNK
ncbi:MAG: hypothetical protein FD170_2307 [Bacteroidetes bacterium]|nr:MAG: hypothetical protein FD170_2307 [Bacteroidota bacterium]